MDILFQPLLLESGLIVRLTLKQRVLQQKKLPLPRGVNCKDLRQYGLLPKL